MSKVRSLLRTDRIDWTQHKLDGEMSFAKLINQGAISAGDLAFVEPIITNETELYKITFGLKKCNVVYAEDRFTKLECKMLFGEGF